MYYMYYFFISDLNEQIIPLIYVFMERKDIKNITELGN
jgi:hypothetical protein